MVQFRTNFCSQQISASFWCNIGQKFLECSYGLGFHCVSKANSSAKEFRVNLTVTVHQINAGVRCRSFSSRDSWSYLSAGYLHAHICKEYARLHFSRKRTASFVAFIFTGYFTYWTCEGISLICGFLDLCPTFSIGELWAWLQ